MDVRGRPVMRGAWLALVLAGPATAAQCPARFEDFWTRFRGDAAFQRAHTAPMIRDSRWEARLETTIDRTVPRSQLQFPLFEIWPGDTVQLSGSTRRRPVAKVRSPDSDTNVVDLIFEKRGCWTLVHRIDASM